MTKQVQAKTQKKTSQLPRRPGTSNKRRIAEDAQDIRDARRALKEAQQKGSFVWNKTNELWIALLVA